MNDAVQSRVPTQVGLPSGISIIVKDYFWNQDSKRRILFDLGELVRGMGSYNKNSHLTNQIYNKTRKKNKNTQLRRLSSEHIVYTCSPRIFQQLSSVNQPTNTWVGL